MNIEEIKEIPLFTEVKINKGTYENKKGKITEINDKFIVIKIENAVVLFPIKEFKDYISII